MCCKILLSPISTKMTWRIFQYGRLRRRVQLFPRYPLVGIFTLIRPMTSGINRSIFLLPVPGSGNSILNWVLKLRKFFEALKSIFYMYLKWKDFKVTKFRIICNTCVLYSSKVPDATTWYISRLQSFFLANVLPLLRLVQ